MEYQQWSAREIAQRVGRGEVAADAIARHFCARIARLEPALNAFADFDADFVLAQARAVDARRAAGESLPFAGVPFTVKDNLWLGGRPATFGSRLHAGETAPRDSWAVARLRALGAIALGVTNCSEFACKGVTETPLHGVTRNPWDTDRTPGGSSGGAVAAVAAGLGPLALGTDAGGSTRRPAGLTGLVGLKPTLGRVPNPWGFADPSHLLSVIGLIGRDVTDIAWTLDALTAWEPADPLSSPAFAQSDALAQVAAADRGPPPRVAWSARLGCGFPVDGDVADAMQSAVDRLRGAGWDIVDADPAWPDGGGVYPLQGLQEAGLADLYGAAWRADPSRFDPDIGAQIARGLAVDGARMANLLRLRERILASLDAFLAGYDALLCPVNPVEAWPVKSTPATIGGEPVGPRGHAAFTPLFNYAGVPAVSIPCGRGRLGLPVGLQFVGRRFADAPLLAIARRAEHVFGPMPACPMRDAPAG